MRDCFIWVYSLKENGDVHLKKDAATYSGSAVFNFVWLSLIIGNTFNFPNRYIFRHHQHHPPHVSARQYLPILCVIFCPFSLKKKKSSSLIWLDASPTGPEPRFDKLCLLQRPRLWCRKDWNSHLVGFLVKVVYSSVFIFKQVHVIISTYGLLIVLFPFDGSRSLSIWYSSETGRIRKAIAHIV